jgi:murein DD-endopeptidase MepM/ murein hydrolase activator NlpD
MSSAPRWVWPSDAPQTVVHPFAPPSTRWGSGHRGVDLAAVVGGSIRAPADGQVAFSGMVAGRPVVVIAHSGGLRSTFEPVSATVSMAALVRQGEVIGLLSAQPGHCAPASCLHWGVLRGEVYLDPLSLISGRVVLLPVR